MIKLRVQDGILLKEYALPWRKEGWSIPPGWMPDDTNEWVQKRAREMVRVKRVDGEKLTPEGKQAALFLMLLKAAQENGEWLHQEQKPWPGWMVVTPHEDRRIVRAWLKLLLELNPQYSDTRAIMAQVQANKSAVPKWPADGLYELKNGKITPVDQAPKGKVRAEVIRPGG